MGYLCPVCDAPQHDGEHLANHLAMTAMLHEDDHEAWLDERVDDWGERTPPELAERIVDGAEAVDYDEAATERAAAEIPTEEGSHEHDHEHGDLPPRAGADELPEQGEVPSEGFLTEAAEAAVAEAREMTRTRRANAAGEDADEETNGDDGNGDGEA